MPKDELFKNRENNGEFHFNREVAEVFDDMLSRSVPCYSQVRELTGRILGCFLQPGDRVYDLGCSTGTTLIELAATLKDLDLQYTGIDSSAAMIEKAALKAEMYSGRDNITFIEGDITETTLDQAGAVILNYTIQFLKPQIRSSFLKKIYHTLRPGGVLILSEKIISGSQQINHNFTELYHEFKRRQGYSEIEISRKKEALENVLIPLSIEANKSNLEDAGFTNIETFFQRFNFVSILGVK